MKIYAIPLSARIAFRFAKRSSRQRLVAFVTAAFVAFCSGYLLSRIDTLAARLLATEQAAGIFAASVEVLRACESKSAIGYYYQDGRAFECSRRL